MNMEKCELGMEHCGFLREYAKVTIDLSGRIVFNKEETEAVI